MELWLLWVIQLAPLLAFIKIQLCPKSFKKIAPIIGILGSALAAAVALFLLWVHADDKGLLPIQYLYKWLEVADFRIYYGVPIEQYVMRFGFLVDKLNLLMIVIVTVISFFVQVFSAYYMESDPSRPRYFAFLSLFSFSMTGLVLSNNLMQTFIFWELVGLSSYLLIGFWYEKKSAGDAARKAFVLNRLGDLGFYLGVIWLFMIFGTVNFQSFEIQKLQTALTPGVLALLGILVFTGIMGKSAQFPLHVWLPDAMEGPTPVSALIHSATMVAAGVFLLARAFPLFSASHVTMNFILVIGSLTAITGACLATIQRDIKKILAYSTISQLGLMVMSMGAGSSVAGMFHLSTHAFFKSLLFLSAGAFIHHFHSNDIWEIGKKGGKKDILTMGVLCIGLLSLSGIFPFAGFFSKDMILETLKERGAVFYCTALFVSFLTAYYSFRLLFVILFSRSEAPGGHDLHNERKETFVMSLCRVLPLISLAGISLWVGSLGTPVGHFKILHWLGGHETHFDKQIFMTTTGLITAALLIAFFQFRNPATAEEKLQTSKNLVKFVLERNFFMDDILGFIVKRVGLVFAKMLNWFDRTIINEMMVNQSSFSVMRLGRVASKLQNGLLQNYLLWAVGAGVLIIFYTLR